MLRRVKATRQPRQITVVTLLLSVVVALLSLGAVLRVYAIPAEARTTEPWYAYKSTIGFQFKAQVIPGKFYPDVTMLPDQLTRVRVPVEPPQYRRVVISKFTDAIEVTVPYKFQGDRAASVRAHVRVDGVLLVPGVWEKPYPLAERKVIQIEGNEVSGVATFTIPVAEFLESLEATRKENGISLEPMEVLIRPVFLVEVDGLPEPVEVLNNPEFKISIRSATLEVDDPREARVEKTLAVTRVSPIMVSVLGSDFSVSALRQGSMVVLVISLLLAAGLIWQRQRKLRNPGNLLSKLGSNLLVVESFQLPTDAALAEVRTAQEMIQLHHQTDRPVIRVGNTCYLLDGTTCYRLNLEEAAVEFRAPTLAPDDQLRQVAMSVDAQAFILDPWITEVQLSKASDLLRLQTSLGKTIIRTDMGFHMLDGSVCYSYRPTH